jgi:16S rRNA (uracil1498-N3)-methyltransferase
VRRRFFVDHFAGDTAILKDDAAHHLGRVLRAQAGQLFELSDGEKVWLARIEGVSKDCVQFALVEPLPAPQLNLELTLLLSIVKFDAFEWALEKATELGAGTIVPLAAERSEKALLAAAGKRAERWKKILLESSQQSRRVRLPVLGDLIKPEAAFASVEGSARILLSERRDAEPLRKILEGKTGGKATLAIGPEGGWTDREFEAAAGAQFAEASVGSLILRTETAVIAALASLNYALGSK